MLTLKGLSGLKLLTYEDCYHSSRDVEGLAGAIVALNAGRKLLEENFLLAKLIPLDDFKSLINGDFSRVGRWI